MTDRHTKCRSLDVDEHCRTNSVDLSMSMNITQHFHVDTTLWERQYPSSRSTIQTDIAVNLKKPYIRQDGLSFTVDLCINVRHERRQKTHLLVNSVRAQCRIEQHSRAQFRNVFASLLLLLLLFELLLEDLGLLLECFIRFFE